MNNISENTNSKSKKSRNIYVSMLKLIAACSVVFIHIHAPGNWGKAMDCLARYAVPLFFMISGYYAFGAKESQIIKRIKKLIILTVIASAVFFAWACYYKYAISDVSISDYLLSLIRMKTIANFIFMGINPFNGHLWYLATMIVVYIIYLLFLKFWNPEEKKNYTPLYIAALCAFLFQIAFGYKSLAVGLDVSYKLYRYGFFFGFPIFALGLFIHQYQERIIENYNFTSKKAILLIILGFALSIIQWFGIGKVEMPLGMFLVIINLMLICMTKPQLQTESKSFDIFIRCIEKTSTFVYIFHPLIKNVFSAYEDTVPAIKSITSREWLYPFFAILVCVTVGMCYSLITEAIRAKNMAMY